MNISRKLYVGFALVIMLAVIIGIVGIAGMQRLKTAGLSMYENQVVGIEHTAKAGFIFEQARLECRLAIINSFYDDKKSAFDAKERFEKNVLKFREFMEDGKKLATTDELLNFYGRIKDLFENRYLPVAEQIIEKSINEIPDHNGKLHIYVMLSLNNDIADRISHLMSGMMELNVALAKQTSIDNATVVQLGIAVQTLLLISAVFFAAIIALFIIKSIMTPINEAADTLHKIAAGDFDVRVMGDYSGEFAIIKDSVNTTAASIKTYMLDKLQAERAAHESELAKGLAEAAKEAVMLSIEYAGKIQKKLLPPDEVFKKAFSDYCVIWEPRYTVGGDIYWIKNFDEGTVLCICDCTGHGTPGALLTMFVVSTFEAVVTNSNYKDTAEIIWLLEKRLVAGLNVKASNKMLRSMTIHDGCDLAVLFIAKDGNVTASSSRTHIFICDGKSVTRLKGQNISVGEGNLKSKDDIMTLHIPENPDNKFYIASDGLFDQLGGEPSRPFGYRVFHQIILENHAAPLSVVSGKIMDAFEKHRNQVPRADDVELITFKL